MDSNHLATMNSTMNVKNKRIFVAGHQGMVGSAIVRNLKAKGFNNLLTVSRSSLDLTSQSNVQDFFKKNLPEYVIIAAAKVGGIQANNCYPADFIYENLMIEANLIHYSHQFNVNRLLFLGSSCIYPKYSEQPIGEKILLSGKLEPTNEPYAIAKIAGIKLCESYNRQYSTDYRSLMPTNLYGPGDNFNLESSHVIPALMKKIHDAKIDDAPSVDVWGTGLARREFLHVDDLAEACIHILFLDKELYSQKVQPMNSHLNIGTGVDITIAELADTLKKTIGYTGQIKWDTSKPEGTPQKLLDISQINNLGWVAKIQLDDGLRETYEWFVKHKSPVRK
ncbi:MAG: GDP-L-fucose synthase [Pseudomonadales bacterium]